MTEQAGKHHSLEEAEHNYDAWPVVSGIDGAVESVREEQGELSQLHGRNRLLDSPGNLDTSCCRQVVFVPADRRIIDLVP